MSWQHSWLPFYKKSAATLSSNIFHTLHLLLFFFKVTPRFLTKSLMFCTERLAKTGCSAFLHCWHSIIVASLPLKMWLLKCLMIAATSLGDHCLFCFLLAFFLSASRLTTRERKTDYQMVFTQQSQQQKQSQEQINIQKKLDQMLSIWYLEFRNLIGWWYAMQKLTALILFSKFVVGTD